MLDKWISISILVAVVCSVLSIFVSDIFFSMAGILWLADCYQRKKIHLKFPPFFRYLLFFLLATIGAIAFSNDISTSLYFLIKLIKYFYVLLIFTYVRPEWIEQTLQAIFVVLTGSALYGILQYFVLMDVTLLNRIEGFMGHWMTFSGQLMLCSVAMTGYLLFYRLPRVFSPTSNVSVQISEYSKSCCSVKYQGILRSGSWILVLGIFLLTLILTQTRNAWLGTIGGVFLLLWMFRLRWMLSGIGVLFLVFLILPGNFKQRFYSGLDSSDTTTRIRIELFHTGANIIKDNPWWGLGPKMVPRAYQRYNTTDEFPKWIYQHLHNNFLHIAAEMGLITLGAWIVLWAKLLLDFVRFKRDDEKDSILSCMSTVGIGVIASFLLAGLFEYNFGDSEILILLLFFVTVPYVLKYSREKLS